MTNSTNKSVLLPCPFCESNRVELTTAENGYEHFVECECGAHGPEYDFDADEPDLKRVTNAWNQRAADARIINKQNNNDLASNNSHNPRASAQGNTQAPNKLPLNNTDKLPETEAIKLCAAMIDAAQARGYEGTGMGSALEAIEKRYILVRRKNDTQ